MARIEAQIVVEDKASGPLGRMSQAARRLSGDMGEAQSAAGRMSATASGIQTGPMNRLKNAISSMTDSARTAGSALASIKNIAAGNFLANAAMQAVESIRAAASGIQTGPMNRLKNAISSMTDSARTAGSALASIKNIAAGNFLANAAMQAVESIRAGAATLIKLSDEMAGIHARINLVSSGAAQAAEMNNLIYASAMRSRGAYDQMAKSVATVAMTAKNIFPDPRQAVPFTGPMNRLKNAISSMTDSARTAGSALASIKNIAAGNFLANAAMQAVESIRAGAATLIKLSDEMAGIHARINLVSSGAAQAAEMNNLIYASAMRSRGAYDQMAKSVATVAMTAKNIFPDPRQAVPFMEGIQKLFAIGGTGKQQQGDALLQLTQALGKGNLQGDEFRSISEAAPLI